VHATKHNSNINCPRDDKPVQSACKLPHLTGE
jgi:hypothetical protein